MIRGLFGTTGNKSLTQPAFLFCETAEVYQYAGRPHDDSGRCEAVWRPLRCAAVAAEGWLAQEEVVSGCKPL
jgi:hypothetical protein